MAPGLWNRPPSSPILPERTADALPHERGLATREERVDAGGWGRPDRCADARSRIRPAEHVAGVRLGNAAPEVGPEDAEDSRSASLSTGISRLSHRREGGQLRIWQRRESSVQALRADDHAPGISRRGPATYSRLRCLHAQQKSLRQSSIRLIAPISDSPALRGSGLCQLLTGGGSTSGMPSCRG